MASEKKSYPTIWIGDKPQVCEICNLPVGGVFIDGKTKRGPWAIMCEACFKRLGVGLGQGQGQKYDAVSGHKLEG